MTVSQSLPTYNTNILCGLTRCKTFFWSKGFISCSEKLAKREVEMSKVDIGAEDYELTDNTGNSENTFHICGCLLQSIVFTSLN